MPLHYKGLNRSINSVDAAPLDASSVVVANAAGCYWRCCVSATTTYSVAVLYIYGTNSALISAVAETRFTWTKIRSTLFADTAGKNVLSGSVEKKIRLNFRLFGRPADAIQDRDAGQQLSAGHSIPVCRWALPAGRSSHRTSTPAVGRLRQTRRATDSHSHWSQELCCFRSRDLEQFTSWSASVDTVHGHLRTTPESVSLSKHWMTCVCSASDFT